MIPGYTRSKSPYTVATVKEDHFGIRAMQRYKVVDQCMVIEYMSVHDAYAERCDSITRSGRKYNNLVVCDHSPTCKCEELFWYDSNTGPCFN